MKLRIYKFCVHPPKYEFSIAYKPNLKYLLQFIVRVICSVIIICSVSCSSNIHGIHLTRIYFQIIWKQELRSAAINLLLH